MSRNYQATQEFIDEGNRIADSVPAEVGPLRLVWTAAGRYMICDERYREVVRPVVDVHDNDWYKHADEWKELAFRIVRAVNAEARAALAKAKGE